MIFLVIHTNACAWVPMVKFTHWIVIIKNGSYTIRKDIAIWYFQSDWEAFGWNELAYLKMWRCEIAVTLSHWIRGVRMGEFISPTPFGGDMKSPIRFGNWRCKIAATVFHWILRFFLVELIRLRHLKDTWNRRYRWRHKVAATLFRWTWRVCWGEFISPEVF